MSFSAINDVLYLDNQDFTTATGDNNDVPLSSSNFKVTCTSDNDALTGLMPPLNNDGAIVWLVNSSASNTLVIKDNISSTVGYRFRLGGGSTMLILEPGQGQLFNFTAGIGWIPVRVGTYSSDPLP